jgi:hypothetical protein
MALGWTKPLKEMSTMDIPGGKGRPARKTDNLTVICEPIVYKMWEPRRFTTLWASTACYRDSFTFTMDNIIFFFFNFTLHSFWNTLSYVYTGPKFVASNYLVGNPRVQQFVLELRQHFRTTM